MRSVLVTGCAGFIGSHLARACLDRGDAVVGVDSLTDYYDVAQKRSNLAAFDDHERFEFVEADVRDRATELVDGVDVVFHQAGQPGVRASWREQFDEYLARNIAVTQALLEAAVTTTSPRFVFASSSSVYGNAPQYPVDEESPTRPFSPYGVTKLAAEHLCTLYAANFGLSTVSLRYFSVYGPSQRPDMAAHRLFQSALTGDAFPLLGNGEQVRDFTYVGDVVAANLSAGDADVAPGLVANIAGGCQCSMAELIAAIETTTGRSITIDRKPGQSGDVRRTSATTDRAEHHLGWSPVVDLDDGLARQWAWHEARRSASDVDGVTAEV